MSSYVRANIHYNLLFFNDLEPLKVVSLARVGVAQWVERGLVMRQVASSIPAQNFQVLVEGQSCIL